MAMKKNISKALAMAVMMSVLAGGEVFAAEENIDQQQNDRLDQIEREGWLLPNSLAKKIVALEINKVGAGYTDPWKDGNVVKYGQSCGQAIMALDEALGNIYNGNNVTGTNSTAVGHQNTVSGNNSGAFGDPTIVIGNGSYSVGNDNYIDTDDTFVLGSNVTKTTKGSVILGVDSEATEANVVSVGAKGKERKIVNVKAGEAATDAVNVKQMKDADAETLKKANAYTDEQVKALTGTNASELANKINETDARVDRVGATAAALAAINYQPMAKGQSQVAIGMGGYNGKKATAIGLAYQFDNRISGSVAGAANGSERMFNVGFNYLFGQHSEKDVAQMAAVPGSMSLKEAELQSEVDSLKAHIAKQDAEMAELKAMVKALAAK